MGTTPTARPDTTGLGTQPISATITAAIADFKGVDPTELETPLYDVVDTESLNALLDRSSDYEKQIGGYVQFTIDGCDVTVLMNGDVFVEDA